MILRCWTSRSVGMIYSWAVCVFFQFASSTFYNIMGMFRKCGLGYMHAFISIVVNECQLMHNNQHVYAFRQHLNACYWTEHHFVTWRFRRRFTFCHRNRCKSKLPNLFLLTVVAPHPKRSGMAEITAIWLYCLENIKCPTFDIICFFFSAIVNAFR